MAAFQKASHFSGKRYGVKRADRFFRELSGRLAKFGLSMAEDKSGILRFSRCDVKSSGCFTFLGFEFYWGNTRNSKTTVKGRTSKKKFRASLANLKDGSARTAAVP